MVAYVPPLWFRVMNPRVVAHYRGNMEHSNIKPAIRERVLAEFSGAVTS
jgi:alkane 1-monooxygenase